MHDIDPAVIELEVVRVEVKSGQSFTLEFRTDANTHDSWTPYYPFDPIQYAGYSSGPDPEDEDVRIYCLHFYCLTCGTFELMLCMTTYNPRGIAKAIRHEIVVE